SGGAVYCRAAGVVTFSRCSLTSNTAMGGHGGAVYAGPASVVTFANDTAVCRNRALMTDDVYFSNWDAYDAEDWPIWKSGNGGIMEDLASGNGGGVFAASFARVTVMHRSLLSMNEADIMGDGIFTASSTSLRILHGSAVMHHSGGGSVVCLGIECTVSDESLVFNNTGVCWNVWAAGIYGGEGTPVLVTRGSAVTRNVCHEGFQWAVGGVGSYCGSINVAEGSLISGNAGPGSGGLRFYEYELQETDTEDETKYDSDYADDLPFGVRTEVITVTGSVISGNNATLKDGGGLAVLAMCTGRPIGVCNIPGIVVDRGSLICNNSAVHPYSDGRGGGISGTSIIIRGASVVEFNEAMQTGGGISVWLKTLPKEASRYGLEVMESSSVSQNTAHYGGGVAAQNAPCRVVDAAVASNTAYLGGGLYVLEVSLSMESVMVTNNSALEEGGGLAHIATDMSISLLAYKSAFIGNDAGKDGGAIYSDTATAIFNHSRVAMNFAQRGGGIYGVCVEIDQDSSIDSNAASGHGGGVYLTSAGIMMESAHLLVGNRSVLANNTALRGGGAYISTGCTVRISQQSHIMRNSATEGGGISLNPGVQMLLTEASSLAENTAHEGAGGVYVAAGSALRVDERSAVVSNTAKKEGGGIFLAGSNSSAGDKRAQLLVRGGSHVSENEAILYSGGGIAGSYSASVMLADCTMQRNVAAHMGGALFMLEGFLAASNATFEDNSAESEGGAISGFTSDVALLNVTLARNQGEQGGAVYFDSSCVVFRVGQILENTAHRTEVLTFIACPVLELADVLVRGNGRGMLTEDGEEGELEVCELQDGGVTCVVGVHLGTANVTACSFENNFATGLSVMESSAVRVLHTAFTNQHAADAAGVAVAASGALDITACVFTGNRAQGTGGAIVAKGELLLEGCAFVNNSADEGGALWAALGNQSVQLRGCEFRGNHARNGGMLFLQETAGPANLSTLAMEALCGDGNSAAHGGSSVYWKPWSQVGVEWTPPPECRACHVRNGSAGYGNGLGVATPAYQLLEAARPGEQAGGRLWTAPLRVRIADFLGHTVVSDNSTTSTIRLLSTNECASLAGQLYVVPLEGMLDFRAYELHGKPGATCQLSVAYVYGSEPGQQWSATLSSSIGIRHCIAGEQLEGGATDTPTCQVCAPGFLSFSNESACARCADHPGVICPGGANFAIEAGAWVAPGSQWCDEDTQCFLDQLYEECSVPAACDTAGTRLAGQRGGVGAASVANLELCEESYSGTLMCGGTEPVLCRRSHYAERGSTACSQCPSQFILAVSGALVGAVVILALLGLFAMMWSGHKKAAKASAVVHPSAEARRVKRKSSVSSVEVGVLLTKLRGAMNILLGYIQVMGQLSSIFTHHVPSLLAAYSSSLNAMNLNLCHMVNFKCVTYAFSFSSNEYGVYIELYFSMATPLIIVAIFLAIYAVRTARHTPLPSPGEEAAWREDLRCTCAASALFLIVFVHPSVAMEVCMLFDCHAFFYDSVAVRKQWWLKKDSSVKCYTTMWTFAAVCATITTVCFIFGLPLMVFVKMRSLRKYRKAQIQIEYIKCHKGLFHSKRWQMVHLSDTELLLDGYEGITSEESDGRTAPFRSTDYIATPFVEVYMQSDTFAILSGDVVHSVDNIDDEDSLGKMQRETVETSEGMQMPVLFFQKVSVGDHGAEKSVPVTMLDARVWRKILGQFVDPFEDDFYFWNCWEICRRLLQSGFVVVVSRYSESSANVYSIVVSMVAIMLHQKYNPYRFDDLDALQLLILVSQFFVQLGIIHMHADSRDDSTVGVSLLGLQVTIMIYSTKFIFPVFRPAIIRLLSLVVGCFKGET
ncbi:hypothetical protein CYMTET_21202, partial [Cymbomonas tetramitiformis]